jgi:T5orf172 domain/Sel1 repeat
MTGLVGILFIVIFTIKYDWVTRMKTTGSVYVLANSAMPGLVKVGKTQRSATERAQELSNQTGIPTPFIVVYEQLFEDCDAAENYVHAVLDRTGIRESSNREFFRATPKEVIEALLTAPGKLTGTQGQNYSQSKAESLLDRTESDELDDFKLEDEDEDDIIWPWTEIWKEAEAAYYGSGDTILDYEEAMKLYIQCAKLGCPCAYRRIGEMYNYGEGVEESDSKALEFFKKGARQGDYYCYAAMATRLFWLESQPGNYIKAMKLFFKTRNESINKVVEKYAEETVENIMIDFIHHILTDFRVEEYREIPIQISSKILEEMSPYKTRFIEDMMERIEYFENCNESIGWLDYARDGGKLLKCMEWAKFNL